MARRRGRRTKKQERLGRRVGLALAALLFTFCCVVTAGEHYGWPTPRWSEVEAWFGVADAPAVVTDGDTELHFIDVGQADATLIRQGSDYALVDAGDLGGGDRLVEYLRTAGVQRLRCVVMTHPHADHIGGMPEVLQNFPVDEFLLPDFELMEKLSTSDVLARTLEALKTQKENGCTVTTAARGQEVKVGAGTLKVLLAGVETDNANNLSVCVKFSADGLSCLFTGDGEAAVEKELLAVEPNLRADIFQAGHHGSSTSNGKKLLAAVRPQYIVISCGQDNSYGHPHDEVLRRFEQTGALICRTDQQGSVVFSVAKNGEVSVHTARESGG